MAAEVRWTGEEMAFFFGNLPEKITAAIPLGEDVEFELEENGTTGYQWAAVFDAGECKVELDHRGPRVDKGLAGAPGRVEVELEPRKTGTVRGKLVYRRSWEKDVPPIYTVEVEILVRPANKK